MTERASTSLIKAIQIPHGAPPAIPLQSGATDGQPREVEGSGGHGARPAAKTGRHGAQGPEAPQRGHKHRNRHGLPGRHEGGRDRHEVQDQRMDGSTPPSPRRRTIAIKLDERRASRAHTPVADDRTVLCADRRASRILRGNRAKRSEAPQAAGQQRRRECAALVS